MAIFENTMSSNAKNVINVTDLPAEAQPPEPEGAGSDRHRTGRLRRTEGVPAETPVSPGQTVQMPPVLLYTRKNVKDGGWKPAKCRMKAARLQTQRTKTG